MYSPKKLIKKLEIYLDRLKVLISNTDIREKLRDEYSTIEEYKKKLEELEENEQLGAENIREGLKLEEHLEGGFFREFIRTESYTVIFYLLPKDAVSSWHCLQDTEETFELISGNDLIIPKIGTSNVWISEEKVTYDNDVTIKKHEGGFGDWFGAYPTGDYGLVTCTCKGPFEFVKFKMAEDSDLANFKTGNPVHKETIEQLMPTSLKKNTLASSSSLFPVPKTVSNEVSSNNISLLSNIL